MSITPTNRSGSTSRASHAADDAASVAQGRGALEELERDIAGIVGRLMTGAGAAPVRSRRRTLRRRWKLSTNRLRSVR
jgi:hypothetical protein